MTQIEAEAVAAFLHAEGLEATVVSEEGGSMFPVAGVTGGAHVLVRAEDLATAEAILADRERAAAAARGDEAADDEE
jgi:hypothetical protein